jgi:CheY-like chemotaxis protein
MSEAIGRPMEILLVEDGLVEARFSLAAIGKCNFQHRVTLVRDGQEALDFLAHRGIYRQAPRPDLVLLDLRLPGIDGLDILAEIKHDEGLKSIPVVVMTASDDEQDRVLCEKQGIDGYCRKPLNVESFLTLLRQLKQFWQKGMLLPLRVTQSV